MSSTKSLVVIGLYRRSVDFVSQDVKGHSLEHEPEIRSQSVSSSSVVLIGLSDPTPQPLHYYLTSTTSSPSTTFFMDESQNSIKLDRRKHRLSCDSILRLLDPRSRVDNCRSSFSETTNNLIKRIDISL